MGAWEDSGTWNSLPASPAKAVNCRLSERPVLNEVTSQGMAVMPLIPALETDSYEVSSRTGGLHRETLPENKTTKPKTGK